MNGEEKLRIDRSKAKLKEEVDRAVTSMFKKILDFVEVSVDESRFSALRKKILRESNDTIRSIKQNIDLYYEVKYVPNKEDVLTVVSPDGSGIQNNRN